MGMNKETKDIMKLILISFFLGSVFAFVINVQENQQISSYDF